MESRERVPEPVVLLPDVPVPRLPDVPVLEVSVVVPVPVPVPPVELPLPPLVPFIVLVSPVVPAPVPVPPVPVPVAPPVVVLVESVVDVELLLFEQLIIAKVIAATNKILFIS